jgi:bifunctional non-homologous end joining protein LigD
VVLPQFTPAELARRSEPLDSGDYLFELKMDGFRALAYVGEHETRLVSRRGNVYKSFPNLTLLFTIDLDFEVVLDGEIVCLDAEGRPQFYELLRRRGRGEPVFYVFDFLWLDGRDLRSTPLMERKRMLRDLVPEQPSVLLYAHHVESRGCDFFRFACERDLEGVVAKLKSGAYGERWYKIRNPKYSQYEGRRELFEKKHAVRT